MVPDGLRDRHAGRPSTYVETAAAWDVLAILDRQTLSVDQVLEQLEPFHAKDIKAAYWLTRRRAELQRQAVLVDGEDAGRAARIRARKLLARALKQAILREESPQAERAIQATLAEIRGSPPTKVGTHLRSPIQALILAGSPQPLCVRLRRLIALHPQVLANAKDRMDSLAPGAYFRRGWPSRVERPAMIRTLELAIQLQQELQCPGR